MLFGKETTITETSFGNLLESVTDVCSFVERPIDSQGDLEPCAKRNTKKDKGKEKGNIKKERKI